MKRTSYLSVITLAALAIATLAARPAVADDETNDTEIKVTAPLDAADCAVTPPTITVLGLQIDVSAARIEAVATAAPTAVPTPATTPVAGDDGNHGHGGHTTVTSSQPAGCYYSCNTVPVAPTPTGCAALVVGQPVEVKLANDGAPLAAIEVTQDGEADQEIEVQAPIQALDPTGQTITVLGLVVEVSGAALEGADDESIDGNSQPIDLSQLIAGQFVELRLASSTAPLAATELQAKNFSNQIEVEVDDLSGHQIEDVDSDLDVEVIETIGVQGSTVAAPSRVKKLLHFHTGSNGSFVLRGLATGRARIFVTRVTADGTSSVGRRAVAVRGNVLRPLRLRLRPAHNH